LDGVGLIPDSDDLFDYFIVEKHFFQDNQNYKMVFCIERSNPKKSGIITFFQIKKEPI